MPARARPARSHRLNKSPQLLLVDGRVGLTLAAVIVVLLKGCVCLGLCMNAMLSSRSRHPSSPPSLSIGGRRGVRTGGGGRGSSVPPRII